jgi:hypothetical protein
LAGASITFFLFSGTNSSKPVILFVNQGNAVVNEGNFAPLLTFVGSHGFNTIFFQVYRSGTLLFNDSELHYFVSSAHSAGLKIFFDLYFTNSTQQIPTSVYGSGEDGINLDMSTLPLPDEQWLFTTLQTNYKNGMTAVTTTDVNLPLKPGLLILETYGVQNQQFIHHGIVGSVGVFATSSLQDYHQQFEYALNNSDGVMVFDYAGLLKRGY